MLPVDVDRRFVRALVGSHHAGDDPEFVDIVNVTEDLSLPGELDWQWVPLAAGDCTFHSGCAYHRADGNRTAAMREAMPVANMSADAV